MASEENLTISWLNQRYVYDARARDAELLKRAMALLAGIKRPRVIDVGAGSGNNALCLLPALPENCELQLLEQHAYLLQACKTRLQNAAISSSVSLSYLKKNLHVWLQTPPAVDLICNSALLDLLTQAELDNFLRTITESQTPLYSTLVYAGASFSPSDPLDAYYLSKFEQHMSRRLDRGQPLGAASIAAVKRAVEREKQLAIEIAPSPWVLSSTEHAFIRMNLSFYQRGVQAILDDLVEQQRFAQWLANKHALLDQGTLALRVAHQDILIHFNHPSTDKQRSV